MVPVAVRQHHGLDGAEVDAETRAVVLHRVVDRAGIEQHHVFAPSVVARITSDRPWLAQHRLPPATRRMPLRTSAGHSRVTKGGVLDSESVTLSTSTWTSSRSTSVSVGMVVPRCGAATVHGSAREAFAQQREETLAVERLQHGGVGRRAGAVPAVDDRAAAAWTRAEIDRRRRSRAR